MLIQLIENVNLIVCHCSNITLDVFCYVLMDIMPIRQVTVYYQVCVTPVYHMAKMEQLNVCLLALEVRLLILIRITALQFVQMVGMAILIHADKLA